MKKQVIDILPGDILQMSGRAGPDGVLWSYSSSEDPSHEVIFKGPGAFVEFEMQMRLKDKGRGRGDHRLTAWAKRLLGARA